MNILSKIRENENKAVVGAVGALIALLSSDVGAILLLLGLGVLATKLYRRLNQDG